MPKLLPLALPTFLLSRSYSVRSLSVCSVPVGEFCQGFPRLSHLLGMFDSSIQGAEKGSTFLHHAVEMHLVEEVTLRIAEVLGAKPGQSRQEGILQKAPGEKWCRTTIIYFGFQPHSNITVPAAQALHGSSAGFVV